MLFAAKLIGEGTEDSPFRVNFPSYNMRHVDYEGKIALVELPGFVIPTSPITDEISGDITDGKSVRVYRPTDARNAELRSMVRLLYPDKFSTWRVGDTFISAADAGV